MRTLSTLVLGLVLFAGAPSAQIANIDGTSATVVAGSGVLAKSLAVNLNAVADTALTVTAAKYIVRKFIVTNCSGTPVLAQVAVYTGASASGTTVVTAAILTTLTGSTKFVDMTLALTTDTLAASTLFVRNAVVQGSALTCDVYVVGDVLP